MGKKKPRKRKQVDGDNVFAVLPVDDDCDTAPATNSTVLTDVYGPDALPSFELQGTPVPFSEPPVTAFGVNGWPATNLGIKNVQELLLWLQGDAAKPKWIFVKNKPLIPRVVTLALRGVTESLMQQFGAAHCPFLMSLCRFATKAPGNGDRIESPLPALLERPLSKAALKRLQAELEPPPSTSRDGAEPDDPTTLTARGVAQLLTRQQLVTHNFPLPLRADDDDGEPNSDCACVGYIDTRTGAPVVVPTAAADDVDVAEASTSDGRLVAIDCEMVRTSDGTLALAWLAAVDADGTVLLDTLVKPALPVTDYLTRYSGVTEATLADVETTLADAQQLLLEHVNASTILCGHSLENDLHALQLVHRRVLDTSVLFPRGDGVNPRIKHALRYLCTQYLQQSIQAGESHSPIEDARAAMALVRAKLRHGSAFGTAADQKSKPIESIFRILEQQQQRCTIIDRAGVAQQYSDGTSADAVVCADDAAVNDALASALRGKSTFVWAQLGDLAQLYDVHAHRLMCTLSAADTDPSQSDTSNTPPTLLEKRGDVELCARLAEQLAAMDATARAVYDALPIGAALVMPTMEGDSAQLKKFHQRRRARREAGAWALDGELRRFCEQVRDRALTFLAIKQPEDKSNEQHAAKRARTATD